MTYLKAIRWMETWRRVEKRFIWAGLAWPLSLFLMKPKPMLIGWLILLLIFLVSHQARVHYRKIAEFIHDKTK